MSGDETRDAATAAGFTPGPDRVEVSYEPVAPTPEQEAEFAAGIADRILEAVDAELELLTSDGWALAYAVAIKRGRTHTARRIDMAKALALYAGRDRR